MNAKKNQKLIGARETRGLTQRELAGIIGTSSSYIARVEAGLIRPRIDTARKIARALRTRVDEIFLP